MKSKEIKKQIKDFLKCVNVVGFHAPPDDYLKRFNEKGIGVVTIHFEAKVIDTNPERKYKPGDVIKIYDKTYTITLVDDSKCCLCATDGYSWNMSFEIKSYVNITKQELDDHIQDYWTCISH